MNTNTVRSADRQRVAVIGAGFIGTHVAQALLDRGIETVVFTRSPLDAHKTDLLSTAEVIIGDASAREVVRRTLSGVGHVIYCAVGLMPAESNLDPAADASLSLPPLINVLEVLRDSPGASITFLSSAGTVYGRSRAELISEEHPTNPITSYGVLKLAGEKYVLMYQKLYGLRATILRCANVYGSGQPEQRSQGIVAALLGCLRRGDPFVLFGDGSIVRDFVHVDDIVGAVLAVIDRDVPSSVFNIGSGTGTSLGELLALAEAVAGIRAVVEHRPDRGYDVPRVVLDISRASHELGLTPTPVRAGIEATWNALVGT